MGERTLRNVLRQIVGIVAMAQHGARIAPQRRYQRLNFSDHLRADRHRHHPRRETREARHYSSV
ncbi:hypothetical protein GCM10009075_04390 [Sphingomonas trueperi]